MISFAKLLVYYGNLKKKRSFCFAQKRKDLTDRNISTFNGAIVANEIAFGY